MGAANNGLNIVILDACRDNPITTASLDKIVAYERQHGGNAASRSYINKGLKVALANVNSADALLEYQSKFGYLLGAPAQIEARLTELLAAGTSLGLF